MHPLSYHLDLAWQRVLTYSSPVRFHLSIPFSSRSWSGGSQVAHPATGSRPVLGIPGHLTTRCDIWALERVSGDAPRSLTTLRASPCGGHPRGGLNIYLSGLICCEMIRFGHICCTNVEFFFLFCFREYRARRQLTFGSQSNKEYLF